MLVLSPPQDTLSHGQTEEAQVLNVNVDLTELGRMSVYSRQGVVDTVALLALAIEAPQLFTDGTPLVSPPPVVSEQQAAEA